MRKCRASSILDDTSSKTRKKCNAEDSSGLSVSDMADLQGLQVFTQISAGKCTDFGIVALIHLCVDKPVFNLDGIGFPGKLLWVRILIAFIRYDSLRQRTANGSP